MKHDKKPRRNIPRKSASVLVKLLFKRHKLAKDGDALSLKEFCRYLSAENKFQGQGDERSDTTLVGDYFFNKRANFKVPQLGVGKTKKSSQSGGKK